jgi:hypothetical protein
MDKCAVHLARRSTQQDSANSSLGDTEPAFKLAREDVTPKHPLSMLPPRQSPKTILPGHRSGLPGIVYLRNSAACTPV